MYTRHGWHIPGTEEVNEPPLKDDCGGPGPCPDCNSVVTEYYIDNAPAPKILPKKARLIRCDVEYMKFDGTLSGATPIVDWLSEYGQNSTFDPDSGEDPFIKIDFGGTSLYAYKNSYVFKTGTGSFMVTGENDFNAVYTPLDN